MLRQIRLRLGMEQVLVMQVHDEIAASEELQQIYVQKPQPLYMGQLLLLL
jgi:hypothetical protein